MRLLAASVEMTIFVVGVRDTSNGKGKGEMRGSFDCVTHKVP